MANKTLPWILSSVALGALLLFTTKETKAASPFSGPSRRTPKPPSTKPRSPAPTEEDEKAALDNAPPGEVYAIPDEVFYTAEESYNDPNFDRKIVEDAIRGGVSPFDEGTLLVYFGAPRDHVADETVALLFARARHAGYKAVVFVFGAPDVTRYAAYSYDKKEHLGTYIDEFVIEGPFDTTSAHEDAVNAAVFAWNVGDWIT